jgi:hypothetical protein
MNWNPARCARWLALVSVLLATACGSVSSPVITQARPAPASAIRTPAGSPAPGPASPSARAAVTPRAHASSASAPAAAPAAGDRLVTFVNQLSETIWVAASPDPGYPLTATGWELPAGGTVTITVPNHWNGRFWGRTGCVFHNGVGHCQSGDCDGRFQCTGYGTIPATLAEYDLDAWDDLDFYDVSMVDGSNLPMYINTTAGDTPDKISSDGCVAAGCTTAVDCPSVLAVRAGDTVVGCESACARFGTDQYCCRGPWAPRADCDPAGWPVDYAAVFKRAEPYAYSYVDDDATSVYTCEGTCNYRITFGLTP